MYFCIKQISKMEKVDFTIAILSNKTPEVIYQTLLDVRSWWWGLYGVEFTGNSENADDVFTIKAGDGAHYSEHKLVELIPGKKIVWLVTEANLAFLENKKEWVGTKLIFEISEKGERSEVKFIHEGLTPASECYDSCAPTWTQYLQTKLFPLLNDKRDS